MVVTHVDTFIMISKQYNNYISVHKTVMISNFVHMTFQSSKRMCERNSVLTGINTVLFSYLIDLDTNGGYKVTSEAHAHPLLI